MEIRIATIGGRSTRMHAPAEALFSGYCERLGHSCRCQAQNYPTEEKLLTAAELALRKAIAKNSGRAKPLPTLRGLVLLDSRGQTFSTEQFADWLRHERDQGAQRLVFAVGPANGWSEQARQRAGLLLSLGPMTLPHELAAVVLAEQIYRAFTIIEGHPYHLGHR